MISRIDEDPGLVRAAEEVCNNMLVQVDVNRLADKLEEGHEQPGIGRQYLFGDVYEHRAKNGGRLYVNERKSENIIEILAKSRKKKTNQEFVINRLKELYK